MSVAAATAQIDAESKRAADGTGDSGDGSSDVPIGETTPADPKDRTTPAPAVNAPTGYYGKFTLDSVRAIRQVEEILQNVVEHLRTVDGGSVDLTFEINASSPGFDDRVQRVVRENANQLKATAQEFE